MIISASIIKKPRKIRYCSVCNKEIIGETLRTYGSAHSQDPKYCLYTYIECSKNFSDPKIKELLNGNYKEWNRV